MSKIFFDLDGTLINAQKRLYDLFQYLVPQSQLTITGYWDLKRSKINHKKILIEKFNYSETEFFYFQNKWMNLIETSEYLEKDVLYDGVEETLEKIKTDYNLNLVTARQSSFMVYNQLEKFGLSEYFENVFITEQKMTKVEIVKDHCSIHSDDYLIGDTGHDVLNGKELGLKTIAVSYGFLSREALFEYTPDLIIDNIYDISTLLNR
ncbi:pyrophosphatase PpaX [Treponema primitia ZAS-2]|uniref:phosphoglycolate phosphatase n=1 Tax=Treponema primitia (strain ATCC BAA-887 / DSM 12427 / ZAS-2) TaxID=545694 RepID=F5YN44_TREPZ|nr:HAD hydrolase-like protein [Treponema primitia]AEF86997.1 pyrophosphatase PpaX [Treponema primitia ZAS-2]